MSTGGGSPSERATPASKRKHKSGGGTETSVGVYCRFRPENKREVGLAAEGGEAATFEYHPQQVVVRTDGEKKFNLDALFPPDTQQAEVYDAIARDMVESIVHGFNGTIFAYGQTGSGKSHSMMGPGDLVRRLSAGDVQSEAKGIIPRAVDHLFSLMTASPEAKFKVSVSYLEVYQEKISDLLVPDRKNTNLKLVERVASRKGQKGRFETVGLTRQHVTSAQEVVKCLSEGDACRTIRSTDMNAVSSRSHAVLEILVERENADGSRKEGTLNLVDLAGSEDSRKTGATGQGLKEAQKINQSLSALSGVIKALSEAKTHVPYRDSTLTKILMSSLGGNCRTSLLLAASPSFDNVTETVSTLRFGERAKRIKTAVVANEKKSQAALQKQVEALLEEIVRLKAYIAELERAVGQGGGASGVDMGELQRTATAAAVGRHGDAGVGELVLLEAKLAEEKEKGKMLEIELRAAQAETQAAEADQPAYIRRAEEAEAKALKAEEDAEQGVSERLAEMERACAARVAKAEVRKNGFFAPLDTKHQTFAKTGWGQASKLTKKEPFSHRNKRTEGSRHTLLERPLLARQRVTASVPRRWNRSWRPQRASARRQSGAQIPLMPRWPNSTGSSRRRSLRSNPAWSRRKRMRRRANAKLWRSRSRTCDASIKHRCWRSDRPGKAGWWSLLQRTLRGKKRRSLRGSKRWNLRGKERSSWRATWRPAQRRLQGSSWR
eukprot:COSAG06_NODE_2231_length_7287_cov_56.373539_9_plen_722_part_00